MTARYVVASVVLLASGLCAGEDKKDDKDKLQGEWAVVSIEKNGKMAPDVKGLKVVLKGNEWAFRGFPGPLDKVKFTFKVDAAKNPKQIDIIENEEREAGEILPGIYKLEGGTLTVCWLHQGGKRPREFKSEPAGFLMVCKRRESNIRQGTPSLFI